MIGAERWERLWFRQIPPHSYALLRIAFGVLGLVSLAGLTPVDMYWPLDGLTPVPSDGSGPRPWLAAHGLGTAVGWGLYMFLVAATVAMTLGWRSDVAVLSTFMGLVLQHHWNRLPLSSAHLVMTSVVFCLLWTETGRVWSIDARQSQRGPAGASALPAWPLWLVRCQVMVIYGSSGLWKLASPVWQDGSAVHWALNLNTFHRFPWPLPASVEPVLSLLTWGTLAFELLFPLGVCFRRTRPATLLTGVALHLGLFAAMELGPFSLVMIASYIAFLDPEATPSVFRRRS